MGYHDDIRDIKLINLTEQLENPTLVRTDINVPVDEDGNIPENNLRMQVAANNLKLLSYYTGIVLCSHQGRPNSPPEKPDLDNLSLRKHTRLLQKLMPMDVDIEFLPYERCFTREAKEKISNLKPGDILVWDNVRFFEDEYDFDPDNCNYSSFFKSAGIKSCVNDAIPSWHRDHSSMMCLPYVADTYVGMRSSHELHKLQQVMDTENGKGIIVGGIKPKWKYLSKISEDFDIFTGGGSGQVCAAAKGYDLGEKNNRWINMKYGEKDITAAENLVANSKKDISTPIDFIIRENGDDYNVYIEELGKTNGTIMDIGDETVKLYAEKLQDKEIRIRAGPLGVFEEGYDNGIELTLRILGEGLYFLGGDTSQEVMEYDLLRPIVDAGGYALVSGGAWLHGLAGNRYPSVDLLMGLYS